MQYISPTDSDNISINIHENKVQFNTEDTPYICTTDNVLIEKADGTIVKIPVANFLAPINSNLEDKVNKIELATVSSEKINDITLRGTIQVIKKIPIDTIIKLYIKDISGKTVNEAYLDTLVTNGAFNLTNVTDGLVFKKPDNIDRLPDYEKYLVIDLKSSNLEVGKQYSFDIEYNGQTTTYQNFNGNERLSIEYQFEFYTKEVSNCDIYARTNPFNITDNSSSINYLQLSEVLQKAEQEQHSNSVDDYYVSLKENSFKLSDTATQPIELIINGNENLQADDNLTDYSGEFSTFVDFNLLLRAAQLNTLIGESSNFSTFKFGFMLLKNPYIGNISRDTELGNNSYFTATSTPKLYNMGGGGRYSYISFYNNEVLEDYQDIEIKGFTIGDNSIAIKDNSLQPNQVIDAKLLVYLIEGSISGYVHIDDLSDKFKQLELPVQFKIVYSRESEQ